MKYSEELNKTPGERLKKAIRASKYGQQKKFAEATHFTEQYISDMCRGIKQIGYENAYTFGQLLNVRPEYLLCLDDRKTDTCEEMDKSTRLSKLAAMIDKLKELYDIPNICNCMDAETEYKFVCYLDEQLQNAFTVYFKYF